GKIEQQVEGGFQLHLQSAQDAEAQQHIQVATTLAHQLSGQLGADLHGKALGRAWVWIGRLDRFRVFVLGTHSWTGCERVHLSPPERKLSEGLARSTFPATCRRDWPRGTNDSYVRLGLPPDERGWHGKGLTWHRSA